MASVHQIKGKPTRWVVRVADGTMPNGRPWQISSTVVASIEQEAKP